MIGSLRRRLRADPTTPVGRDAVLGAVVAVLTIAFFLVVEKIALDDVVVLLVDQGTDAAQIEGRGRFAVVAVIVAQAMFLTLRRRSPLLCLALVAGAQVALVAVMSPIMSFQAPATLVAAYSVGAYARRHVALGWAGGAAVVQTLLGFVLTGPVPEHLPATGTAATQLWTGLLSALVAYVGATLIGVYVGTRRELETQLRGRAEQAEREREALASRAVLEERNRMARELHDIAAHHLSGIVVQAAAAERLVGTDPDRARESLRWIRTQGRSTLDDLRLVVGLLRSGDRPDGRDGNDGDAPQPTLADVPQLFALARSTGADVHHETRGEEQDVPPHTQRTVYRVLQESLANARRHAPGQPVTVVLDHRPAELVLTVRNRVTVPGGASRTAADGRSSRAAPPGHGLIGMSERAVLVGGTLEAGATPDGAWRVRLTVPRAVVTQEAS